MGLDNRSATLRREALYHSELQPNRFYLPAYIASRGWVALRLDVGKMGWEEVRELLLGSYTLLAPKRPADRVKPEV